METDYKLFDHLEGFHIKIVENDYLDHKTAILMVNKKVYKMLEKKFKEQEKQK